MEALTGKDVPFVWDPVCSTAFYTLREDVKWNPGVSTAKSLCASTVAFRPGSHVSDIKSTPSVDVSGWEDVDSHHLRRTAVSELDRPIDLTDMFYLRLTSETSIIWTVDFIQLHI